MTESGTMPSEGKRSRMIKRIGRDGVCFLLSAVFVYAGAKAVIEKNFSSDAFSVSAQIKGRACPSPNEDELEAARFEIPEIIFSSGEQTDVIALYDELYSKQEAANNASGNKSDRLLKDGSEPDEIISTTGLKIISQDLSRKPESPDTILMSNYTSFDVDAQNLLKTDKTETKNVYLHSSKQNIDQSKPLVLIIHTHGTEGYASEHSTAYEKNNLPRTDDITKNVVAVGEVLCETLNENGVPAIHCETMHDLESYSNSYNNAKKTILEYLEKYPSIRYIYDVHRDAIVSETSIVKAITYDGDAPVAQVMFVVGTNERGADHPNWLNHLAAAVKFQYLLNSRVKNIARPISLRAASFNEQYTDGSLLIEIGTCANTLSEAKRSAVILGETLSKVILDEAGQTGSKQTRK